MSAISSAISPDNINLGPSSFGYPTPRIGKPAELGAGTGIDFKQTLNMKVNGLKAAVSEPLRAEGLGGVVKDFVLQVDEKGKVAESMRTAILTGESNNLHQSMIASQEASVSFTLMIEMRNKVMETYQELMRMQI